MHDRIEIRVSKRKVFILLIGTIVFTAIGIWIVGFHQTMVHEKIIGIVTILFFGAGMVIITQKLFKRSTGIIIDKYGITDYITKPHVGTIEWKDILHANIDRSMNTKMLMIYVEDPEKYLNRIEPSKRRGLTNNYKLTGTPFVIPSSILEMKLEELEELINSELRKQEQRNNHE